MDVQQQGKLVSLNCGVLFWNSHMFLQSSLSPLDLSLTVNHTPADIISHSRHSVLHRMKSYFCLNSEAKNKARKGGVKERTEGNKKA